MAYVDGGNAILPLASTGVVLNATGFDRLLLVHISTVSQNTLALWKNSTGLTALTTTLVVSSGDIRDLGPFFFGSTANLLGGAVTTSSGWYQIDELRV